jgi:hypothetical protein
MISSTAGVEEQLERRDLILTVGLARGSASDPVPQRSVRFATSASSSVAVQLARRFSASSDFEPCSAVKLADED